MRTLDVALQDATYRIFIGAGLRHQTGAMLCEMGFIPGRNHLYFITDQNVGAYYLDECIASATQSSFSAHSFVIPSGESSKSIAIYSDVITDMIAKGLDRQSVVVALGGGVVGDLAGFCAATFMRGIAFVQMPTTLLAHDSSVGGKVGINHPLGKNMLGAFHQPKGVIYDSETLKTLPRREFNAGFAELIKEAWLAGNPFFEWLSKTPFTVFEDELQYIEEAIYLGCSVKIDFVSKDVKESGVRAFLNFGHTVGHALEQVTKYGKYLHGEAVAIGLVAACRLSETKYGLKGLSSTMENVLDSFSLPIHLPPDVEVDAIIEAMRHDKKARNRMIVMVLTKGIGKIEIDDAIEEQALKEVLESMKNGGNKMNPKKAIVDLPVYVPGKPIEEVKKEFGLTHILKLASNENPYGCSPHVKDAIVKESTSLHLYPDGAAAEMRQQLADFYGISEDRIIVGNGSDEIIQMISRAFYIPGSEAIMADITFPRYKTHAVIEGATIYEVPLLNGKHDLHAMASHVSDKTSVVWICNPNNPTGTIISREEFEHFIKEVPPHVLVVVDEAYYEYVSDDAYPQTLELTSQYKNLLILRTFSKIYGLAGLRVGYGLGDAEIISLLNRVREPFNANRIAQAAVLAALEDQQFIQSCYDDNRENMAYLTEHFRDMGLPYFQSEANFILVNVKSNATELFGELLKRGIIVRSGDALGYPEHIRVTIGTREQNEQFISELKELLSL